MKIVVSALFLGLAGAVAIPTCMLFVEVFAAVFLRRRLAPTEKIETLRGSIAVLVPAHNESSGLIPTLDDIKRQLHAGDRLVVVADNCSDDTAAIAEFHGAEVTVRSDPSRMGKGYALDWGVRFLKHKPPQTVIVVDADCQISDGCLRSLADASTQTQRPAQALYLMTAPAASGINHQVAEFAWRLKNWVRPLGLKNLGLPCQLVGSGMAFPWKIIQSIEFSSGHLVEDLKLGIEFAVAGAPPLFCPSAVVTSRFPTSAHATETQRQRWEHGHIGLILRCAPALFYRAFVDKNLNLFALALDLCVPPVALLAAISLIIVLTSASAALFGVSSLALALSSACFAALVCCVSLAWSIYGRDIIQLRSFALIVSYGLSKLRMYKAATLGHRISSWIRTDRS